MRVANTRTLLALVALMATLSLAPARTMGAEKEENEKDEVKVKLADVPASVRTTLDKEARGAKLPEEIDKETDNGKTLYEADVKIGGKNYEIKVAEDGTLLSKKLDEEDEKGEKHEKEEKD